MKKREKKERDGMCGTGITLVFKVAKKKRPRTGAWCLSILGCADEDKAGGRAFAG